MHQHSEPIQRAKTASLRARQKLGPKGIVDGIEHGRIFLQNTERQVERRCALHAGAGRVDQQADIPAAFSPTIEARDR